MYKTKIIIGIIVVLLASLACGLTDTISGGEEQVSDLAGEVESLATTAAEAEAEAAAVPQAVLDDPQTYLQDALRAQMMSAPFRASMTQVSPIETTNYTVEYQPPDRFHMIMPGVVDGIIIGQVMYINLEGTWMEIPLSDDFSSAFGLLGPDEENLYDTIQEVTFDGIEMLASRLCMVFTYSSQATVAGVVTSSTSRLWLGVADGRVYQIISEGDVEGTHTTTTIVYEYDPEIEVEAPY
jgi:hypothetical protein